MPLSHIIYISRSVINYQLPEKLNALHVASQETNLRLGVSGILLFKSGCFMQLLEGQQVVVTRLFDKIATDTRHVDVQLLCSGPIGARIFDRWSMGLLNLDEGTELVKHQFDELVTACRHTSHNLPQQEIVRNLYREFRDQLELSAAIA